MSAGKVKCQFFLFFFPTEVIYLLFQWSLKEKKCQFLWSIYVCKAKTDICQFFSVFYAPFPKLQKSTSSHPNAQSGTIINDSLEIEAVKIQMLSASDPHDTKCLTVHL